MSYDDPQRFQIILGEIEPAYRDRFLVIAEWTDAFCANLEPMADEYMVYCWLLAGEISREGAVGPLPLMWDRSKVQSWAAGVVWTLGWVNFLTDGDFEPSMTADEAAAGFGISAGTMQGKSKKIRDCLDIRPLDPRWTLPSMAQFNPLIWMVEDERGMILDLRQAPRWVQVEAYERGLIPYVWADVHDEEDEGPGPDVIGFIGPN